MGRTYRKLDKKQKKNLQKFRKIRHIKRNIQDDEKPDRSKKTDMGSFLFI